MNVNNFAGVDPSTNAVLWVLFVQMGSDGCLGINTLYYVPLCRLNTRYFS